MVSGANASISADGNSRRVSEVNQVVARGASTIPCSRMTARTRVAVSSRSSTTPPTTCSKTTLWTRVRRPWRFTTSPHPSPNPADMDYNLYFSPSGATGTVFVWNGKTYTGITVYQTRTGKDGNAKFADPQFLNTTTPDLHVQSTSPAVNAGINLGSAVVGTLDFAGNPRVQGSNIDIGAYEQ
jgi:hypothetical protein